MALTEGGLLTGHDNSRFGPDDSLARKQVDIIRYSLYGQAPYPNGDAATASRTYAVINFMSMIKRHGGTKILSKYETPLIYVG